MSKPEDIPQDIWDAAVAADNAYIRFEAKSRIEGIARAIMDAKAEEREAIAAYIEGHGGMIPGTAVFGTLVSRNNMPCMSGDPRDRLHSHVRRNFDDATAELAAAIRNRGTP